MLFGNQEMKQLLKDLQVSVLSYYYLCMRIWISYHFDVVNPRDIPFCKVGNGTYKIFTDSILIIIFGFIHSRWWRRVSIADFLSWLALLNISSKLYIAFAPLYLSFVFYPLGHVFPSFVIQNSLLVYLGLAFVWFQTSRCIISTDIEHSQLPANYQKESQSTVVFILFVFSDLSMDQKIQ